VKKDSDLSVLYSSSGFDAFSFVQAHTMVVVGTAVVGGPVAAGAVVQGVMSMGSILSAGIVIRAAVGKGAAIASSAVARATTAAAGLTAGAISRAAVTSSATAANRVIISTLVGGVIEGAVTTVTTGAVSVPALEGAITVSVFAGLIRWAILGADRYTWNCWKPVVIDNSVGLSCSIALCNIYNDPNLQQMTVDSDSFVTENICDKQFCLSLVDVDSTLAFHTALI
jgi:hypothetical protein